MIHELKTWTASFEPIWLGQKTAEFRRDDRGFALNDTLHLREWDPRANCGLKRAITARVSHVLRGPDFCVPQGFVMLSLQDIRYYKNDEQLY